MKFLFTLLAVLVAAVSLALVARQDPGYVLITRGDWTAETSLTLVVAALVIGFGLGYALVRLLVRTWRLPRGVRRWRHRHQLEKARDATHHGLVELSEGHWRAAERTLIRHAGSSELPLLNYLSAARAAQKQNASDRRDRYLQLALKSMPDANLAVELTQAELQLVSGQFEQSLATLMHLRSLGPRHPYVLQLLMRLYERMGSWKELLELLPELRRRRVLPDKELEALEYRVHHALLDAAGRSGDGDALREAWQRVPKYLRQNETLVYDYGRFLRCAGEHDAAENLLRSALNRQWSDRLAYLYGLVQASDRGRQLAQAESWLKERERNPQLLLTAARLAMRNQLWGKARSYLEASLGANPQPETYHEMGRLLEQLEEHESATDYYRQGLILAADDSVCRVLGTAPASAPAAPPASRATGSAALPALPPARSGRRSQSTAYSNESE